MLYSYIRYVLLALALLPNWRTSIYPLSVRYIRISVVATGWLVWGLNPGGGEIFRTRPEGPWSPPRLLYNGSFPRVKRSGRDLSTHPRLSPRLKKKHYTSAPPLVIRGLF
jgi:hypothetical protein